MTNIISFKKFKDIYLEIIDNTKRKCGIYYFHLKNIKYINTNKKGMEHKYFLINFINSFIILLLQKINLANFNPITSKTKKLL